MGSKVQNFIISLVKKGVKQKNPIMNPITANQAATYNKCYMKHQIIVSPEEKLS